MWWPVYFYLEFGINILMTIVHVIPNVVSSAFLDTYKEERGGYTWEKTLKRNY